MHNGGDVGGEQGGGIEGGDGEKEVKMERELVIMVVEGDEEKKKEEEDITKNK